MAQAVLQHVLMALWLKTQLQEASAKHVLILAVYVPAQHQIA